MTIDFRASQIQFNKLIASGSTGTGALALVYPISAQNTSNPNQGIIDPTVMPTGSIGTDIFIYFSGGIGSKNTTNSHGVSVFAGDLVISGTLYALNGTSGFSGGEVSASYIVLNATSSLANERVLTGGPGITLTDNGAGSSLIISATVGYVTGTNVGTGAQVFSGSSITNTTASLSFFTITGISGVTTGNTGSNVVISGEQLQKLTISSSAIATIYTSSINDVRRYVRFTTNSAINLVISASSGWVAGDTAIYVQAGGGQITFLSTSNATVNAASSVPVRTRARYSSVMLTCISTNNYDLTGDLEI